MKLTHDDSAITAKQPKPNAAADYTSTRHAGRWRDELPQSPWRWLLLLAWCSYRLVVWLKTVFYLTGMVRAAAVGVPVISIGNLTAGGTGKTPLVQVVVQWCLEHRFAPAVLSRGYRGQAGTNDEALLIQGCPVICEPDRLVGAHQAIAAGATCLILDDGFQHRRLHRDVDIVLVDATRPWGRPDGTTGALLPLGYLREPSSALDRAHLIAVSRCEAVSQAVLTTLMGELARTGKPIIRIIEQQSELISISGGTPVSVHQLSGRRVLLVSGLGNPVGFERSALRHGWLIAESMRFPDHFAYPDGWAKRLSQHALHLKAVTVMTSKDAVKLAGSWPTGQEAWVLQVRSDIHPDDKMIFAAQLGGISLRSRITAIG